MPARPLSDAQREKIRRTVIGFVGTRGFDGWRITDLVSEVGISSRTLYKYFPSKEYLVLDALVVAAGERLAGFADGTEVVGSTPNERVDHVLGVLGTEMFAQPELSTAMIRSLTCGQEAVRPLLLNFHDTMQAVVARALAGGPPTDEDRAVAEIVELVWISAVISWACQVRPAAYVNDSVHQAMAFMSHLVPSGAADSV
jgi:AcrR family transcriptional regulator